MTDSLLRELGARGRRLYREVMAEYSDLGPRQRVVLEEAARTADRLDILDRILRGDDQVFVRLDIPDFGPAQLLVDKVLSESRQQQMALARLMGELRQSVNAAIAAPKPVAPDAPTLSGGGKIADLTSRIAERRNAASR